MCSYRVCLTVGHESEWRPGAGAGAAGAAYPACYGGATHDWRLYVRGAGGEDISNFVSKIVFTLHRSCTYPKRVIHEPPYEIRESGYGSFEVPIYVYIKHSTNPSKIKFRYKLLLQNQKPLSGSQKFSHVFNDPPEPVKSCLIKGGAKVVEPKKKKPRESAEVSNFATEQEKHYQKAEQESELYTPYRDLFGSDINLKEKTSRDLFGARTGSNMDQLGKVATVNLNRVSDEQLKRKHSENVTNDTKRRKTGSTKLGKFSEKPDCKDVVKTETNKTAKKEESRTEVKKFTVNGDIKIRTPSEVNSRVMVKSDKSKKRPSEMESEKPTEAIVVDHLKKACKLVEMSSGEIDQVSNIYQSLSKYENDKTKDSLKLPSFNDPIYRLPELPEALRQQLAEMDKDNILR